jgi:hypothetical protein
METEMIECENKTKKNRKKAMKEKRKGQNQNQKHDNVKGQITGSDKVREDDGDDGNVETRKYNADANTLIDDIDGIDNLFSVDLVEQAKKHIIFLCTLHKQGTTINIKEELSEETLRRYLKFWLPFVAHHHYTDVPLIPPPDIVWFWHCHRLAPYRYAKYVQREFFSYIILR